MNIEEIHLVSPAQLVLMLPLASETRLVTLETITDQDRLRQLYSGSPAAFIFTPSPAFERQPEFRILDVDPDAAPPAARAGDVLYSRKDLAAAIGCTVDAVNKACQRAGTAPVVVKGVAFQDFDAWVAGLKVD